MERSKYQGGFGEKVRDRRGYTTTLYLHINYAYATRLLVEQQRSESQYSIIPQKFVSTPL